MKRMTPEKSAATMPSRYPPLLPSVAYGANPRRPSHCKVVPSMCLVSSHTTEAKSNGICRQGGLDFHFGIRTKRESVIPHLTTASGSDESSRGAGIGGTTQF